MTPSQVLLIFLIMAAAGLVQGATGFGSGLVAIGLLTWIIDVQTGSVLLVLSALSLNLAILYRLRRHFHWERIWPLALSAVVGVPFGVLVLAKVDPQLLRPVLGVLLYLSGLGNIDQSVYDAAEIDGCGWFRKFWNIELPLIMTQVRLNLILMVVGTLKAWQLIFILLGPTGGSGNVAMVPGLYMFSKGFSQGEYGYACAVGLLLFLLTVVLTVINNRSVRVSK